MNKLLEMKTNLIGFVEKNEALAKAISRFVLMLTAYLLVFFLLGFYAKVHKPVLPVALAVISAFLPAGIGTMLLSAFLLLNLYGLGIEVTAVAAALLLLCYILYFRFAPGNGYLLAMTPIAWMFRIPYALPVTEGLISGAGSAVPVMMGTVVYYFLKALRANPSLFVGEESQNPLARFSAVVKLIIDNKEMWLVVGAFMLTALVVSVIRKTSIRNAWRLAIYVGVVIQTVTILIGKLVLGSMDGVIGLMVGSVISLGIDLVVEFFLFHLDYSRVERVQFEDDYYYYYVKAVPKVTVRAQEKKVTTFGSQGND